MIAWALGLASAGPMDPAGEAILREDWIASVDEAEALGRASGRELNVLPDPLVCTPAAAQAAARAQAFAEAWGRAVSDVGRLSDAMTAAATLPTLAPLRSAAQARADAAVHERARRTVAAHRGLARAVGRLASFRKTCPASVEAGPGWPRPDVAAADDPRWWIAVWVTRPAWLCTPDASVEVQPGPAVVGSAVACLSDSAACGCRLADVAPGAAL